MVWHFDSKKKQIKKNSEQFNNENIGNIDTVGYANQEISDNDEKQSEFHPDCLENENVVFDDFSNSSDENENEDFKEKCFKEIQQWDFSKDIDQYTFCKQLLTRLHASY